MEKKFELGKIVATPLALSALENADENAAVYLNRHQSGDWGDLGAEDKATNEEAIKYEGERAGRTFSAYYLKDGTKIYVITEWDRSVTTVLLPEDY